MHFPRISRRLPEEPLEQAKIPIGRLTWARWRRAIGGPRSSGATRAAPGHLGNVPHVWIGAEYVLALLAMLAHERPADGALVLAAGVSSAWLDAGEVAVQGLPTW